MRTTVYFRGIRGCDKALLHCRGGRYYYQTGPARKLVHGEIREVPIVTALHPTWEEALADLEQLLAAYKPPPGEEPWPPFGSKPPARTELDNSEKSWGQLRDECPLEQAHRFQEALAKGVRGRRFLDE